MRRFAVLVLLLLFASAATAAPAPLPKPARKAPEKPAQGQQQGAELEALELNVAQNGRVMILRLGVRQAAQVQAAQIQLRALRLTEAVPPAPPK